MTRDNKKVTFTVQWLKVFVASLVNSFHNTVGLFEIEETHLS